MGVQGHLCLSAPSRGRKKYGTFFLLHCLQSPLKQDKIVHGLCSRRTSEPWANPGNRSGCLDPMPPGFPVVRTHRTYPVVGNGWIHLKLGQPWLCFDLCLQSYGPSWQRVLHHFGQLRGGDTSQFFESLRLSLALRQKAETGHCGIRRATLSVGTATVLMSSGPNFRDMGIRVSPVDTVQRLSLVITRALFLHGHVVHHVGLAKQGVRDDRLGALFETKSAWQPQPAAERWRSASHRWRPSYSWWVDQWVNLDSGRSRFPHSNGTRRTFSRWRTTRIKYSCTTCLSH